MGRAIPPLLKNLNERTVLETIRAGAPISRAEISRRAGISKPTVSLALQSLLDAELVRETSHDPRRPTYGAVYSEPVPDAALVLGFDLVLGGELHRGHHGFAGEVDWALAGAGGDVDPSAVGVAQIAAQLAARDGAKTAVAPPYDARSIFAAARSGDALARDVVAEVARRVAAHVAPIAAVADVALVVLGGGLGTNGDLLLDPIRSLLSEWLPYPPRVEVSSLGDAAVLTGAVAVGLRAALDNVFVSRSRRRRA